MNEAKLKGIFVDAFKELEKDALEKTKKYYVEEVARKLYFATCSRSEDIGTSDAVEYYDDSITRLRNRLFELIRESFDEFIYPNQYGALVKQYRKNNCLNQQEFANLSGLSLRTVHNVEHGISFGKQTKKKLDNLLEKQNET
jgi:DNA-binding XRE family transcriptional regulator